MASAYQRVVEFCVAQIKAKQEGIRYYDLHHGLSKALPDVNRNTILGAFNRFRNNLPEGIVHPVRGLYVTESAWSKRKDKKNIPTRVDPIRKGKQ